MRVFQALRAAPVCAVLLWLLPAVVHADPILVTGGSTSGSLSFNPSFVSLTGEGLRIAGEGYSSTSGGPGQVGTTATLDGTFSFATISGALAQMADGFTGPALLDGGLTFTTQPFVVQPRPGGSGETTFTVPFTMTGAIQGYAPSGPTGRDFGALLFSIDVFGNGTATQTKTFNAATGFYSSVESPIVYAFAPAAPAATPEPASLLLLGTGVAGMMLRRYRQGSKRPT